MGIGVNSPWYVGQSCAGLYERFGEKRVIDTPVSENGMTGIAIGAAMAGMRPIMVHPRMDFMYYAMDQIANQAANWHYMLGGKVSVPVTIRGIINRGGEQAAQHSQALQAIFAHIPGLKVVMPTTPYDAKGLLISAIEDDNPVIYIDDRWLYEEEGYVPKEIYSESIGQGAIRRTGNDVTIVTTSYMVAEAIKSAKILEQEDIDIEIIDLRSVKPLDETLIFESVKKTGKLVIADGGWKTCGIAAEVSALVTEHIFEFLMAPVVRVTLPDIPAPSSSALERIYYPRAKDIVKAIKRLLSKGKRVQGL